MGQFGMFESECLGLECLSLEGFWNVWIGMFEFGKVLECLDWNVWVCI